MSDVPSIAKAEEARVAHIRACASHNPAKAFEALPLIRSEALRHGLGMLIASSWSRQDINTAWRAVSRSPLSEADKQVMYNELWG